MGDTSDFFKTIPRTFNPDTYVELSRRPTKDAMAYFLSIVMAGFFLLILFYTPEISSIVYDVNDQIDHFEKLRFSTEVEMNEPIVIPAHDPLLEIDTNSQGQALERDGVLVQKEFMSYKWGFWEGKLNIEDYFDINRHRETYVHILVFLAFLALPMTLFLLYVILLGKYLLIIMVLFLLGMLYAKVTRMKIKASQVFKIGMYSSTLPLLIEAVASPFLPTLYFVPQVIHLAYVAIAVILNGQEPGI